MEEREVWAGLTHALSLAYGDPTPARVVIRCSYWLYVLYLMH